MAKTLTFTIADDQSGLLLTVPTVAVPRILTAMTAGLVPQPATQAEQITATRQQIVNFVRASVLNYEEQAARAAKQVDPTDPLNGNLSQT